MILRRSHFGYLGTIERLVTRTTLSAPLAVTVRRDPVHTKVDVKLLRVTDQKTNERCRATPAVTPSALAHVTLWAERVMSPAA